MSEILDALCRHARGNPERIALFDSEQALDYAALWRRVNGFAKVLRHYDCRVVGLMSDNCTDWVVADLAALLERVTIIPLPTYFSDSQLQYLIHTSGIDALIVDNVSSEKSYSNFPMESVDGRFGRLSLLRSTEFEAPDFIDNSLVAKTTFTSGSTGQPKGVCLAFDTVNQVAARLRDIFAGIGIRHHLCVMPLATLLENIAGVYVPLMLGATVHVPSLRNIGLYGSSRVDVHQFIRAIDTAAAESLILQPHLLRTLTAAYRASGRHVTHLKFVAVGGAKVAQTDLDGAVAVGIPAYQGYGLSECCSVVALNHPGDSRPGSVGRPLPGVSVEIDSGGEIVVSNQSMQGYLGDKFRNFRQIHTGDLGYLDDDGFLYITGCKKNVFITSFGRNVSPEWPESELMHQPEISQTCVFGEARPFNTAVIARSDNAVSENAIANAVNRANENLPDYARISHWTTAEDMFSVANGLLTPTGKPKREAIELRYIIDSDSDWTTCAANRRPRCKSKDKRRNSHEAI